MDLLLPFGFIYNTDSVIMVGDIHDLYLNCNNLFIHKVLFGRIHKTTYNVSDQLFKFVEYLVKKKNITEKWITTFPKKGNSEELIEYACTFIRSYGQCYSGLFKKNLMAKYNCEIPVKISKLPIRTGDNLVYVFEVYANILCVMRNYENLTEKDIDFITPILNDLVLDILVMNYDIFTKKSVSVLSGGKEELLQFANKVSIAIFEHCTNRTLEHREPLFPYGIRMDNELKFEGNIHGFYFTCDRMLEQNLNEEKLQFSKKVIDFYVDSLVELRELSKAWKIEIYAETDDFEVKLHNFKQFLRKVKIAYHTMFKDGVHILVNRTPCNSVNFPFYCGENELTSKYFYFNVIHILLNLRYYNDKSRVAAFNFLNSGVKLFVREGIVKKKDCPVIEKVSTKNFYIFIQDVIHLYLSQARLKENN